jgi:hypothetical protein
LVVRTGLNYDIVLNLITKYGVDVTITPITKTTSNIEGDEALTSGSTYSERIYFSRRSTNWAPDSPGLIEGADAIALITPTSSIVKDYKVLHNGKNYRVQSVIDRDQGGGTVMYKTITLFLI